MVTLLEAPLGFAGRCAIAFVEIVLAAAILMSSVVVGHELRTWREWYAAPTTIRFWAPTPSPSPLVDTSVTTPAAP